MAESDEMVEELSRTIGAPRTKNGESIQSQVGKEPQTLGE